MKPLLGLIAATFLFHAQASAQEHAIGAKVGMLGVGIEYSYTLSERLALRGMLYGSSYSFDATESGINYEFSLNFDSIGAAIDLHPFTGPFRVSAGLLINDNNLEAISTPSDDITIGGSVYTPAEVGILAAGIGFDRTAPFIGIGWDWSRSKRFGVSLDVGIVKQGSPDVALVATGLLLGDPALAADIAVERAELEASLDDFDVLPFGSLGITFRF